MVVLNPAASDGQITSRSTTYATARSGGGTLIVDNTFSIVDIGQFFATPNYNCLEYFMSFDTTGLTGELIVELALYGDADLSTTDFVLQARAYSWSSGGLTSGDWLAGASASAQTLLATFNSSAWTNGAYNVFTSETAFATAINPSGVTDIVILSDRLVAGTTPTGDEYVDVQASEGANPPKLTVNVPGPKLRVVTSPMRW